MSGLQAVVVIPARDEAERIGSCLGALANQAGVATGSFEVIVVLDRCTDDTEAVALAVPSGRAGAIRVLQSTEPGVGPARRLGMDLACQLLEDAGNPRGLIACTDADSVVDAAWLGAQLQLVSEGAEAIGGELSLHQAEAALLDRATLDARAVRAQARREDVKRRDPDAEHHFFSGASMAVTAAAYRRAGGLEPVTTLEDEAFERRLDEAGIPIIRSARVRVGTSARTSGRAGRGLARDLELGEWRARRRFDGFAFGAQRLLDAKDDATVSVIIPARDCEETVDGVLRAAVMPFVRLGLIDEVLVVDGRSTDATVERALDAGAEVRCEDDLLSEYGPARGKGDAMWRGLSATRGDVVAFMDADTRDPHPCHLLGIIGPLLCDPAVHFVKGAFARPFRDGSSVRADEGGRVTELMARPLLNLYVPALAGFSQPLAGETAARRDLLESLPFAAGYGVEIALLIDALRRVGLDALAEARLGTRQNRHQSLRELGAMAFAVLAAVERRVRDSDTAVPAGLVQPWEDGAVRDVPTLERPPLVQAAAEIPARPRRCNEIRRLLPG